MASQPPNDQQPGPSREAGGDPTDRFNERLSPDAQPTQPIAVPRSAAAPDPVADRDRLATLRRLSPTELAVLRHRCSGATTAQIATHLGIPQADARAHVGNLLDKLGITYGREGTSLSRLTAYCPLVSQLGASAGNSGEPLRPPAGQLSQRAVELTDADDLALVSQQGGPPPPPAGGTTGDGGQRWIIGGVLAFVLVAALLALLFFWDDDDDGDDTAADEQATEQAATATALAVVEPTATVEEATETPEPEPEPTATDEPATETPEPDEEEEKETEVAATETAEAEPEPTETEVAATETPAATEPTATATPDKPSPTPTEPKPEPTPDDSQLAYEADWSSGNDGWNLSAGWAIENGNLVTSGDASPLLSPFEPQSPNYAVEIEMIVTNLNTCDERAGVFARITEAANQPDDGLVGYAGTACDDEWHIDAVLEDDLESLASGDRTLTSGSHTYRIEVAGEQIRFYIDDAFVGSATDDRWTEAGGTGIFVEGTVDVTISAFRVFTLPNNP